MYIYKLLDGVTLEFYNVGIERAWIEYDDINNFVFLKYKVKQFANKIGNLTISGSPTMGFRLM